MLRFTYFIFFCASWLLACSQPATDALIVPNTDTFNYILGQTTVTVTLQTYRKPTSLFFIHLHDNETTAEDVVKGLLAQQGGQLLSIENNQQRNISFKLNEQYFTFDPNRMFSDTGIVTTIKLLSTLDTAAVTAVKGFASFILSKVPDTALIAAVHNNTDAKFSITSYQTAPLNMEAAIVHINPEVDSDDFILTTDSSLFHYYKQINHNAVLQRSGILPDDGSLSIFFGKQMKRYINIEAEHGHVLQQRLLLRSLFSYLVPKENILPENK